MHSSFDLVINADSDKLTADLHLFDPHGSPLAFHQADFKSIAASDRQGLFDLRNYLSNYVEPGKQADSFARIGICIAEQVLGQEIFLKLWQSGSQRSLRIQLPGATEQQNQFSAALARVPWEIARPSADQPTLGDRNLLVRVVHDMKAPDTEPLRLGSDESLRVLFVFAQARGAPPLAARLERRVLLDLFEKEIYPHRRVEADFLTHGVTREQLKAQIKENGGYHVVHWSGHGHLNLLELARPGGAQDLLSGEELLDLFKNAGGFIPRLFFLSACHSGDIMRVKDWNDFLAQAQGKEPSTKQASAAPETRGIPIAEHPGYTGTAHALLRGGVRSVVAMRYAVGDEYARDLAVEFYRCLLAHNQPKTAAAALTLARQSLFEPQAQNQTRYEVCDHATPVLYGDEHPGLSLQGGRSPALKARSPRLHQIRELTTAGHSHFVGRTWELAGLGSDFIGSSYGAEVKPVALITGLGGMGKTALMAEALWLWESRFKWVLLYQAKPNALGFEAMLRDIHLKLSGELGRYHERVKSWPADAIHRAADAEFTGSERMERLTTNLVRAMRDEAILLVLDNFETNLKPQAEPGSSSSGEPMWGCQDAAWDRCLGRLAGELVDTPSRVLITCRKPIAALAGEGCHRVLLGPLPHGEAMLYVREHAGLREMLFSDDETEQALAMRLLDASRFHPLLMDRLARLATASEELRPQLMRALEALETSYDYSELPELFTTSPGDAKELAYLNDALATSLNRLIKDASPDARRLLWVIAIANEPVGLELLKRVWSGESYEHEWLRQIKRMLEMMPQLPPGLQEHLKAMPDEVRAKLDALPAAAAVRSDIEPLLRYIVAVGLVTKEHTGPEDENPTLACHELVRERILSWMEDEKHSQDRADLTENSIRLAYAERLEAVFDTLLHRNMTTALEAGIRAIVYFVQAGDYDQLSSLASRVITSTSDPRLSAELLPHLEAAAESAPEGQPRWSCLCCLADAMFSAGRPDASLHLYEQAAAQARAAAEAVGENGWRAWSDVSWITTNWAGALLMTGDLDGSRKQFLNSAESWKKAARPALHVISSELEALRIDIIQGRVEESLPEVEARLAQVEAWWQRHRSGQRVQDAPDPESLARTLIGALDIAREAHFARQDWASALRRIDAALEVRRALERPAKEIAATRLNRGAVLGQLGRFTEARADLEDCLQVSMNDPAMRAKALISLAILFYKQGDVAQAIIQQRRSLALCEQLPDPRDRAISHNNLADYLEHSDAGSALAEFLRHRLAALIYRLVSSLGQDLQRSLRDYAVYFRRAQAAGTTPIVPHVAELLTDPAFHSLNEWLRQRQVDVAELQAAVDQVLDEARQAAI
jgi:tetratricopeptide (TPR) repeat protein